MKMKPRLLLAVILSASFAAQPVFADDQPGAPSNASPAGADQPVKKKKGAAAKKSATAPKKSIATTEPLKATPVAAGPAIVTQPNVNVRAQAAVNSEVIVRLKKGDHVNVLELVTTKAKTDEVSKWAKVALPTNAPVWINTSFINAADKTVVPKKLNVRSGPGENYTFVARIPKGTVVKEIESKGEWMKIEPPADATGFIAAHLLSPEPAAPPPLVVAATPTPAPTPPPPTETKVAPPVTPAVPTEPVVPPVTTPPTPPPTPAATPAETAAVPPPVVTTPAAPSGPALEEILVKRVVSREGIVKRSVSIQAPTYFALQSLDTGKTINYLYSPTTNLVLKDLGGKRIMVTGEEMLDERWPNTPVINVDSLQTIP